MRAADQRAHGADSHLTAVDERDGEQLAPRLGSDPGEAETWEIFRVNCPECDRPIALVGDEERLPQHAVLRTAWHPFSPALCPGSGLPADDLEESAVDEVVGEGGPLAALLALPAELDWRTQPFSHALPRPRATEPQPAGQLPGAQPHVRTSASGHRVPAMRKAPAGRLVRR
ncbi:hypothetical protein ACIGXM_20195 [Kitasatospora sp. NPDC052896]|uniref:hypothetical protein n=1 Tax=Kitasatospora sp. NPDC052896 TaxID=3364061 RepID=UPI0037C93D35